MPAIPVHHTPVDTESSWDGPAEVARAAEDATVLRHMHAWISADGDPDVKASYKFPHHKAGSDTPAVLAGVNNAMARLSQADIPDSDRAGVRAHLQAHQDDAEKAQSKANAPSRAVFARRQPIRCFEGSAKPHEAFWHFRNAADGAAELELYGVISEYSWLGDEITPAKFKADLYKFGNKGPITVRINSVGGDPIAASVIRTIMSEYPGKITVQIDGLAASSAVIVAMAGSSVRIMDTAYMMIHDPYVAVAFAILDIEMLGLLRDELKSIKLGIVDTYAAKTGLSTDRVSRMMADETWMSAQEAVDLGFATEVIQGGQKPATRAYVNALLNYANVPPELLSSEQPEAVREDREAQSLFDDIDLLV